MKRAVILASLLVAAPTARAEEAKAPQDLTAYLDQLQTKLDHSAQRLNHSSPSSQPVPLSQKLYWKGRTGPMPVSAEELKTLRAAVDQAKSGKKEEAIAGIQSFLDKYPQSALKPDADETLKRLSETPHP